MNTHTITHQESEDCKQYEESKHRRRQEIIQQVAANAEFRIETNNKKSKEI